MTIDLYAEQERLEREARTRAGNRLLGDDLKKREKKAEASTSYGSVLHQTAVKPLAEAIIAFRDAPAKVGRSHAAKPYLSLLDPYVMAMIASQAIINNLTANVASSSIVHQIARAVEDECRYEAFAESDPALLNKLTKQTRKASASHRRRVMIFSYRKFVNEWEEWSTNTRMHLGLLLLGLFRDSTGMIDIQTCHKNSGRPYQAVVPKPALLEWIAKHVEKVESFADCYQPMVVPPVDWTTPYDGGYLLPKPAPLTFVKTPNRAYLAELEAIPDQLSQVYEAVNRIQSTGWQVNPAVLEVATTLWATKDAIAGLPSGIEQPIRPYPFPDTPKEDLTEAEQDVVREWKAHASRAHAYNASTTSRRLAQGCTLATAQTFAKYPAIYFPHQLDFRGRAYSVVGGGLTPQGDDLPKGLLRFAKGKPIGDGMGPGWLAIHGANVWGEDKVSFADRIAWVEENEHHVRRAAEDPLDYLWWTDADKPFQFLAFCLEWAGYLENGADHITHIPVAMDGSCSGLQHFSATLRDAVGGKAVNLLPAETPQDVYAEVAAVTKVKLRLEVTTSGTNADLAQALLDFGITRNTTKRSTMTLPYGATLYSCKENVGEWLMKELASREDGHALRGKEGPASTYLGQLVWDSIGEVVIAARGAMDWLRGVARELTKEGLPITWTTPDGFPVSQCYKATKDKRIKSRLGDQVLYFRTREEQLKLDSRRQANGVAPNWVHSQDATHLRRAVLYAADNGVESFAVIHDSFGTHACDSPILATCLRSSFKDLYAENPLDRFVSEACAYLPTSGKIPPMPATGTLDLNQVMESDYIFA